MTWASKIATGILNANLSAYIYWQGFEVNQPQASSYLVASLDGATAIPSGRLWAFAMWSRFVRPGARRLGTSGTISSVAIGAFKNTDGSIVVVFTNSGTSTQSAKVSFSGFAPSAAEAWLMDNTHTVASTGASLSGGAVTVSLPTKSVVTVKLTAGGSTGGSSSTTSRATTSAPGTLSTSTKSATSSSTTSSGGSGTCSSLYGQCGGNGWTGPTCCTQGTCKYSNDWYSQCL